MKEIWKDIPDYEGLYQASNLGRIKSLTKLCWNGYAYIKKEDKILKPRYDKKGYSVYALFKNLKRKDIKGHRLIALTFIANPENKPQINHINGIKSDNRINNLEWCTNAENQVHAYKTGLQKRKYGKFNNMAKSIEMYDLNDNLIKKFDCMTEAKQYLNIKNISHICSCCKGKRKSAYGYKWKYKEKQYD